MTSKTVNEEQRQELEDAVMELTAPDGRVFRFRFGAVIPYADQDYVVLLEMENDENGEEQLLITRLIESPEGNLSFEVAEEEDVIREVYMKYTMQSVKQTLDQEEPCSCGHEHKDHGCSCGQEHKDHGCSCGCH